MATQGLTVFRTSRPATVAVVATSRVTRVGHSRTSSSPTAVHLAVEVGAVGPLGQATTLATVTKAEADVGVVG